MLARLALAVACVACLFTDARADELPPQTHRRALYIMDADGSNLRRLVKDPDGRFNNTGSPCWSHDGTKIAFDAGNDNNWVSAAIFAIHVGGETPGLLEEITKGVAPAWSPDGERLACYLHAGMYPDAPHGMYIMNADGSGRRRVSDRILARWSPNGAFLLCSNAFSGPMTLSILDPETLDLWDLQIPDYVVISKPTFGSDSTNIFVAARNQAKKPVLLHLDLGEIPARVIRELPLVGKEMTQIAYRHDPPTLVGVRWRNPNDLRLVGLPWQLEAPVVAELEPAIAAARSADPAWSPDGRRIVFTSNRQDDIPDYFETLDADDIKQLRRPPEPQR